MRIAVVVMVTLALAACGVSTSTIMLDPTPRPFVTPEHVRVFLTPDDVPGEYVRIAVIHAKADPSWNDEAKIVTKLREEAAKLGANGLILGEFVEPTTGAKVANALLGTNADRKVEAVAIWLEEAQ